MTKQCAACGHVWDPAAEGQVCPNPPCPDPLVRQNRQAARDAHALVVAERMRADDGSGDLEALARAAIRLVDGPVRGVLADALRGWLGRANAIRAAEAVRNRAARRAGKPPITCGKVDITEHVAAMFDALVNSIDWGSGFLDAEDIEALLIVAELAGFDVPEFDLEDFPGEPAPPEGANPNNDAAWKTGAKDREAYGVSRRAALAAWRAQVSARARALAQEES